jgi:DNA-binding transcriptional MerR regulator
MASVAAAQPPMTIFEVSERLGVPVETLRTWRKTRTGPPSYRLGRSIRYDVAKFEQWHDEQQQRTAHPTPRERW